MKEAAAEIFMNFLALGEKKPQNNKHRCYWCFNKNKKIQQRGSP